MEGASDRRSKRLGWNLMLHKLREWLLLKPLFRFLLRTVPVEDPWERFAYHVPLHLYGAGARREFQWYFEGKSSVEVTSLDDIKAWLLACEYIRDPDLFHEDDFWQHPRTFEQLRKGDCEDFALWAWRQLVQLGFDAEFVAGHSLLASEHTEPSGHAWVLFRMKDTTYLFDTVLRNTDHMIQPLDAVRELYRPEVSVDGDFDRYAYGGYYQMLRSRYLSNGASRAEARG